MRKQSRTKILEKEKKLSEGIFSGGVFSEEWDFLPG